MKKGPAGGIIRLSKPIILGALLCTSLFAAGAQETVDREELEKAPGPVVFINYEGPYARIETRDQIRNIGYGLGVQINGGSFRIGPLNRYFVIHSVSAPEEDKLDADIFGLGVDTGVDHIRNLRTIIQGYLQGTYNYSVQDAALLAEYVTIYNAVFRGNWDYFNSRYKSPVIRELTPEKAGLSIRFDEWPGQTLMVIPLATGRAGSLSAVDTSSLGSRQVVEELRREEDMGIEQRKEMVDLKEREAAEAAQDAALKREAIAEEEAKIAEERETLAREREQIAQERQQPQTPQGGETRQDARTGAELDAREAAADQKEAELSGRESALEQQRTEAAASETLAEQKSAESRQEREEIARDQQDLINKEEGQSAAARSPENTILGVRITNPANSQGRIVQVNPAFETELNASILNTVNARTVTFTQGKLLAVAGVNRGNGAIRLVEISPQTLEMLKQGNDDIHEESLLWINGNDLYALTVVEGKCRLGRFNANLEREAQSAIAVHLHASVTVRDNMLLTQYEDGRAAFLNPKDLTELRQQP
jgi:hypothetical protein